MNGAEDAPQPHEPTSIIKLRLSQRIDQILDLATRDRAAAIKAALRLRKWLEGQKTIGQAELDRQEILTGCGNSVLVAVDT